MNIQTLRYYERRAACWPSRTAARAATACKTRTRARPPRVPRGGTCSAGAGHARGRVMRVPVPVR
ncbi:hypothetical protein ACGFY6_11935 [Streptomyces sp. NPDC048387]|uniref:hypothetical protein n=1 Tax=Streptomyces sp. NPDC048387 TaxID=3365542 RepID=UPI003721BFDC